MTIKGKSWSKKLRRDKKRNHLELQIERAFDMVDNQVDFKDPSNLRADVPLSLLDQEKLVRSVIDQAMLVDASEKERRKHFDMALRKKRIIKAVVACGVVCALFVAMIFGGLFDRAYINTYDAGIMYSTTFSADSAKYPTEDMAGTFYNYEVITEDMVEDWEYSEEWHYFVLCDDNGEAPKVNREKLSDTLDKTLTIAMSKLDYAYDDKYILEKEYCRDEKGNWYLYVFVLATCIDYKQESEDSLRWKDAPDYSHFTDMVMGGEIGSGNTCLDSRYRGLPYDYLKMIGDLSTKTYVTTSEIIVVL